MLVHCESQALKNHKVYALPVLVDGRGIGVAVIIKYIRLCACWRDIDDNHTVYKTLYSLKWHRQ